MQGSGEKKNILMTLHFFKGERNCVLVLLGVRLYVNVGTKNASRWKKF